MDNELAVFAKNILSKIKEARTGDEERLITGGCSSLEKYREFVGQIRAYQYCESLIIELLKQSE
jgi:hypothetical protein